MNGFRVHQRNVAVSALLAVAGRHIQRPLIRSSASGIHDDKARTAGPHCRGFMGRFAPVEYTKDGPRRSHSAPATCAVHPWTTLPAASVVLPP